MTKPTSSDLTLLCAYKQAQFEQFKTVRVITREQFDSMKSDDASSSVEEASPTPPLPSAATGTSNRSL